MSVRKNFQLLTSIVCVVFGAEASGQTISTYAGGGKFVDAPALSVAASPNPFGVAAAQDGSVFYVAGNSVYRLNTAAGTATLVAGTGTSAYSGDGGPATDAQLSFPKGIAVDSGGNLYIADYYNDVVRRVDAASGVITTYAGNHNTAYSGDGGPAKDASLARPTGVALDSTGNLYITDSIYHVVRRVSAANGTISTFAGSGDCCYGGDGGPATQAQFRTLYGVTVDASGNVYIVDAGVGVVRRVDASSGTITTVAGSGFNNYGGDGGPATEAQLDHPYAVAVDAAHNLYIADYENALVRRVDAASGTITTAVGANGYGYSGDGGPASAAQISNPSGIAIDAAGNFYFSDTFNQVIRRVATSNGTITTAAGNGSYGDSVNGVAATAAQFSSPLGSALDASGNLYVSDNGNQVIRRVDASSHTVTTIAGNRTPGYSGDGGPATSAQLFNPQNIALDSAGNVYVADTANSVIRRVSASSGTITTFAGNGTPGYSGDGGPATSAQLYYPSGVAVDAANNVFIADTNNNVVRRVAASNGKISTYAGDGTGGYSGDGGLATGAKLIQPRNVAVDTSGNLYIADTANQVIRRVAKATGKISTVAGSNVSGYSGDGGPATSAELAEPQSVSVDTSGNLYIADALNNVIRRVSAANGKISTVAGTYFGGYGFSGDGGPSIAAQLAYPQGVSVDSAGNLYISDTSNMRIRLVSGAVTTSFTLSPSSLEFGSAPTGTTGATMSATVTNTGTVALPISSISIAGTNPRMFSQTSNCGSNVAVGASCEIDVVFKPTATGSLTAKLNVAAGGDAGTKQVTLSGSGVAPSFTVSPASLTFGDQTQGTASAARPLSVTNPGTSALPLTGIAIAGTNPRMFSQTNTCGTSIAAGSSCTISVVFKPTTTGASKATLSINTSTQGIKTIALSGNGVVPVYVVSPTSIAFGNQPRGTTSATQPVTVTNTGNVPLPVTSIALTGTNPRQFSQTNNCGSSIEAGTTCTINVALAPTARGAFSATLTVKGGAGAGTQTVAVTGSGT